MTDILDTGTVLPQSDGDIDDPRTPTPSTVPAPGAPVTTAPDATADDAAVDSTDAAGTSVDGLGDGSTTTTTTTMCPNSPPRSSARSKAVAEGCSHRSGSCRTIRTSPRCSVGDLVVTAGGFDSLAPPDIPVGVVVNRADRSGAGGPLLDVSRTPTCTKLNFVRVVLVHPAVRSRAVTVPARGPATPAGSVLMLAALWQGPLVRLVPVGMVLLALQRSIFVEITVDGVIVQVVLALAAAAGAAAGSERGALAGFVLGLMYDMIEGLPLGSTAIAMTLAGAVAGLAGADRCRPALVAGDALHRSRGSRR